MRISIAASATVICLSLLHAGESPEADAAYIAGIAKLRDAQSDPTALVPAARLLAKAIALFEKAGDDSKTVEINSCLYWAKKKFTLADTKAISGSADVESRLEGALKEVPADQAPSFLDKANEYAKSHATDQLMTAIRYFEVADRFKDTDSGRVAMDLTLKAMQKIGQKAALEAYKPVPTDGKAFIKSDPPGASIFLITKDGGKLDTGKVTPTLIQLPVGYQTIELVLKTYKAELLTISVDGKAIGKPDLVKLDPVTVSIDVIFDEGWTVFVNGKPAVAPGAAKAETPCTIEVPMGISQIGLGKDGFIDLVQRIEVKSPSDKVSCEPKGPATKGKSLLLASNPAGAANTASASPQTPSAIPSKPKVPAQLRQGLTLLEYARHASQGEKGAYVDITELGKPIGQPRVCPTLSNWRFNEKFNAVATGYIQITVAGEYSFNSDATWDRNALIVNGNMICPYRDGEKTIAKITLPIGLISITSMGFVEGGGKVNVQWIPPGKTELGPIPTNLLFSEPPR